MNHGRDYYICEVCDGSLADLLKRTLPARPALLSLFDEACAGVECAHRGRVLHRDIKPSNLLRRKSGALVVADFGLCKIDSSDFTTVTSTGVGGGTMRYGAPEQWHNMKTADHRADVYSLGVVLQDLMLGSTSAPPGDIFTPPVPIEDLLWRMEVEAFERKAASYSGVLTSRLEPEPKAMIILNGGDPSGRKRFTLAHELGHLMLHPLGRVYRDRRFIGEEHDANQEMEANRFAADFLMPMWMMDSGYI